MKGIGTENLESLLNEKEFLDIDLNYNSLRDIILVLASRVETISKKNNISTTSNNDDIYEEFNSLTKKIDDFSRQLQNQSKESIGEITELKSYFNYQLTEIKEKYEKELKNLIGKISRPVSPKSPNINEQKIQIDYSDDIEKIIIEINELRNRFDIFFKQYNEKESNFSPINLPFSFTSIPIAKNQEEEEENNNNNENTKLELKPIIESVSLDTPKQKSPTNIKIEESNSNNNNSQIPKQSSFDPRIDDLTIQFKSLSQSRQNDSNKINNMTKTINKLIQELENNKIETTTVKHHSDNLNSEIDRISEKFSNFFSSYDSKIFNINENQKKILEEIKNENLINNNKINQIYSLIPKNQNNNNDLEKSLNNIQLAFSDSIKALDNNYKQQIHYLKLEITQLKESLAHQNLKIPDPIPTPPSPINIEIPKIEVSKIIESKKIENNNNNNFNEDLNIQLEPLIIIQKEISNVVTIELPEPIIINPSPNTIELISRGISPPIIEKKEIATISYQTTSIQTDSYKPLVTYHQIETPNSSIPNEIVIHEIITQKLPEPILNLSKESLIDKNSLNTIDPEITDDSYMEKYTINQNNNESKILPTSPIINKFDLNNKIKSFSFEHLQKINIISKSPPQQIIVQVPENSNSKDTIISQQIINNIQEINNNQFEKLKELIDENQFQIDTLDKKISSLQSLISLNPQREIFHANSASFVPGSTTIILGPNGSTKSGISSSITSQKQTPAITPAITPSQSPTNSPRNFNQPKIEKINIENPKNIFNFNDNSNITNNNDINNTQLTERLSKPHSRPPTAGQRQKEQNTLVYIVNAEIDGSIKNDSIQIDYTPKINSILEKIKSIELSTSVHGSSIETITQRIRKIEEYQKKIHQETEKIFSKVIGIENINTLPEPPKNDFVVLSIEKNEKSQMDLPSNKDNDKPIEERRTKFIFDPPQNNSSENNLDITNLRIPHYEDQFRVFREAIVDLRSTVQLLKTNKEATIVLHKADINTIEEPAPIQYDELMIKSLRKRVDTQIRDVESQIKDLRQELYVFMQRKPEKITEIIKYVPENNSNKNKSPTLSPERTLTTPLEVKPNSSEKKKRKQITEEESPRILKIISIDPLIPFNNQNNEKDFPTIIKPISNLNNNLPKEIIYNKEENKKIIKNNSDFDKLTQKIPEITHVGPPTINENQNNFKGRIIPQVIEEISVINAVQKEEILDLIRPYLIELRTELQLKADLAFEKAQKVESNLTTKVEKEFIDSFFRKIRLQINDLTEKVIFLQNSSPEKVNREELKEFADDLYKTLSKETSTPVGRVPLKCLFCGQSRNSVSGMITDQNVIDNLENLHKSTSPPKSTLLIGPDKQVYKGKGNYGKTTTVSLLENKNLPPLKQEKTE